MYKLVEHGTNIYKNKKKPYKSTTCVRKTLFHGGGTSWNSWNRPAASSSPASSSRELSLEEIVRKKQAKKKPAEAGCY
jgi:hypothetical protein